MQFDPPIQGIILNFPKTFKNGAYGGYICKSQYNNNINRYLPPQTYYLPDIRGVVSRFRNCGGGDRFRVINVLLEKIGYDGEKESVVLTFRSNGIKALAQEMNFREQEEKV